MSQLLFEKFNGAGLQTTSPDASPLNTTTVMGPAQLHPLAPDNPMLWLVGLGAVLFGLIGFNSSGHIGPLKGSVSV